MVLDMTHQPMTTRWFKHLQIKILQLQPRWARVICLEYFSLRANAWKEIEPIHLSYQGCSDRVVLDFGLVFNGVLHWLASRQDVSKHVIAAFDLTKRVSQISLCLLILCMPALNFVFFRAIGGLLWWRTIQKKMWVMKEYKSAVTLD